MSTNAALRALLAGAGIAALTAAAPAMAAETQVWRSHADHVLGTSFDMAVASASEAEARFAFAAAQGEIARLDRVLSGWRSDSELARLNRSASHVASPDLFAVLAASEAWRVRTDGAFDARLGEVETLWRSAQATPDAGVVQARAAAARAEARMDPATRAIHRPEGVRFAPDGLAKGYIIDAALAAARRASPCAAGMLIDIGGDLRCYGESANGEPWRVGVAAPGQQAENALPAAVLALNNAALAVSGPGPRDRMVDGAAISHLLDPNSGQPAGRSQVAVISASAADADAAATALAVIQPSAALALAERLPGIEALIFAANGERLSTSGWARYESMSAATCQSPIPANFALEVRYELPQVESAKYRKPYTVIWITDASKALVRTLLVVGNSERWHESSYVWWRRYGRNNPELLATAKPTRAPGKYSAVWDGLDDKGKRVPQGQYIVHIETTREHGGHDYQSMPVTLGAKPVTATAPAAAEMGAALVRYARK